MGAEVALLCLSLAGALEPLVDAGTTPPAGLALALGVQRHQDEFGLIGKLISPRFLDDHLAISAGGGLGWYPDLRALPMNEEQQDYGAWALYGHARLAIEASTGIALASGRIYASVGPSVMFLSESLSTTTLSLGVHGVAGVELFAGDAFQAYPFSFYFEIGGTAHTAAADKKSRIGADDASVESQIDRPIGTGLALGGGLRVYLWQ